MERDIRVYPKIFESSLFGSEKIIFYFVFNEVIKLFLLFISIKR